MDIKQQRVMDERADLLLIKPLTRHDVQGIPPLGLGFISAAVKKAGFTSTILDCNARRIAAEQLPAAIDLTAYGLIGIQAFHNDLPEVLKCLRAIKAHAPQVPVIIGGAAPASDPAYVFKFLGDPDYLCVGEGEHTLCALLKYIRERKCLPSDLEHVPNLCWRDKDGLHLSRHEYIDNLDEIGSPDWEGIDPSLYPTAVLGSFYRRSPVMPIFTSRGCPFRCNYCGGRLITGYKVRRRSPESVVGELAWLKEHCGIREFQIADDNFTSSAREALAFVRELKARKLDLLWTCPCGLRLDSLNRELLEAMKDAGCYEVAVGIESGDPRILRAMNKHSSPEKVEAMIRLIDEVGIHVVGLIIVGYPGETKESLQCTMDYVLRLPMVRVSLTRFFPIRGTAVTEQLLSRGEIKEEDLEPSQQNEGKYTYLTPELNEKTLRSLYRTFFLRFLLRPKIIWHTLRSMRSFSHIKFLFRRVLAYLK